MKKLRYIILALCCFLLLSGCSGSNPSAPQKNWNCTVICAEESSDNAYVISYSDERIISGTGILTVENENNFDIVVHLTADSGERVEEIKAGGILILYQIAKDTAYTLGCHADVPEGTEIIVTVYDGEGNILTN